MDGIARTGPGLSYLLTTDQSLDSVLGKKGKNNHVHEVGKVGKSYSNPIIFFASTSQPSSLPQILQTCLCLQLSLLSYVPPLRGSVSEWDQPSCLPDDVELKLSGVCTFRVFRQTDRRRAQLTKRFLEGAEGHL